VLLNKGFEGERSSASALGALALPYRVLGRVITHHYPSEGDISILGALALPSIFLGSVTTPSCPF
jgi:hypothetical protein